MVSETLLLGLTPGLRAPLERNSAKGSLRKPLARNVLDGGGEEDRTPGLCIENAIFPPISVTSRYHSDPLDTPFGPMFSGVS